MSRQFNVTLKEGAKLSNLRAYDSKGWSFSSKWWDGVGDKDVCDAALRKAILFLKEAEKAPSLKEETRARAKLVLTAAVETRARIGKLETSEELARLLTYQVERYTNRVWAFDTVDARRELKHPWKKLPEKKEEAAPKEEAKAPAKAEAPAKKATTRKSKAKAAPKEEAAPASNEAALAKKLADLQAQLAALASLVGGAK